MFVPSVKFREVIQLTPLISIDLLIENENGEYLFGLRNNRPAKNKFFVPGGRIRKNE
ncbi:TPA: GDP-mannose mannosyl hydrolase, partial [Escherichia coli]